MPLSFASIRASLAIFLLCTCFSCASAPSGSNEPARGTAVGAIRVSGNHPYERQLVLAGETGGYWLLRAPELEAELLLLDGQSVRAHGIISGGSSGPRELTVEWYELVAPHGGFAAVGRLGSYRGSLVLLCDRYKWGQAPIEVSIEGPLRESLGNYVGYRVWISGERVGGDGEDDLEAAGLEAGEAVSSDPAYAPEPLRVVVREYGVLGPPTPPLRDVPHSTYPDSSR